MSYDLTPRLLSTEKVTSSDAPQVLYPHISTQALQDVARLARRDIVQALFDTGGGHYGGSLSVVDTLLVLYYRILRLSPRDAKHASRDRFILSKGHAAIALYAVLQRAKLITDDLASYASLYSRLEGHPDMTALPYIEFSTGSLGQGLAAGLGMAHGLRSTDSRVWVVLGDGECQEGQVWESVQLAGICRRCNLVAIVDCNQRQEWGWGRDEIGAAIPPIPNIADKWRVFGWQVYECHGNEMQSLVDCLTRVSQTVHAAPVVIIAHTQKGAGVPFIASQPQRFHCDAVTPAEHLLIMESLS